MKVRTARVPASEQLRRQTDRLSNEGRGARQSAVGRRLRPHPLITTADRATNTARATCSLPLRRGLASLAVTSAAANRFALENYREAFLDEDQLVAGHAGGEGRDGDGGGAGRTAALGGMDGVVGPGAASAKGESSGWPAEVVRGILESGRSRRAQLSRLRCLVVQGHFPAVTRDLTDS